MSAPLMKKTKKQNINRTIQCQMPNIYTLILLLVMLELVLSGKKSLIFV